ncbi:MAG TPA: CHAT domain-containing protein [Candidatus Angelobacter sp.]|nr:CHAT domain-containing protein [Candidatus Angelobacter sp.]
MAHPAALSLKAIQSLLDSDTTLLEYSLGDEKSWLWAVSDHSLNVYALPKRADIEVVSRHVYRLLSSPNQETGDSSVSRQAVAESEYIYESSKLSNLTLNPVADLLKRTKRLVIVSDGALQYIPFAALPPPGKPVHALPLVLSHEIVDLPSASILAELRKQADGRATPPKTVAILADPVFDLNDERLGAERRHSSLALSRVAGEPDEISQ